MSAEADTETIASFLYEESRVERYRSEGYTPMWHELDANEQSRWYQMAHRLQYHLKMARKVRREMAARAS